MNKIILPILLLIILQISCKDNGTDPPPKINPPGWQEDIPWPSLADSPWPKHRFDAQNTGRSPYVGPASGTLDWTIDTTFYLNSELILDTQNNLFVLSCVHDIALFKFNSDGKFVWRTEYTNSNKVPTTPLLTASGNFIYADNVNVYSANSNGELNWSFDALNSIFITGMNIDKEGNIYFTDAEGILYSLDQNGNMNWSYNDIRFYSNEATGMAFSPDGKTLYIPGWQYSLFAFDITERKVKWSINKGQVRSSPMVDAQGNVYIITRPSETDSLIFYSFSSDGNEKFSYVFTSRYQLNFKVDPTIDRNGNLFFAGDSLYSLDYSGKFRWKLSLPDCNQSPIVNDKDGNIYLITSNYELLSVKNNGTINWSFPFSQNWGAVGYSPIIGMNNRILMNVLGVPLQKTKLIYSIK